MSNAEIWKSSDTCALGAWVRGSPPLLLGGVSQVQADILHHELGLGTADGAREGEAAHRLGIQGPPVVLGVHVARHDLGAVGGEGLTQCSIADLRHEAAVAGDVLGHGVVQADDSGVQLIIVHKLLVGGMGCGGHDVCEGAE